MALGCRQLAAARQLLELLASDGELDAAQLVKHRAMVSGGRRASCWRAAALAPLLAISQRCQHAPAAASSSLPALTWVAAVVCRAARASTHRCCYWLSTTASRWRRRRQRAPRCRMPAWLWLSCCCASVQLLTKTRTCRCAPVVMQCCLGGAGAQGRRPRSAQRLRMHTGLVPGSRRALCLLPAAVHAHDAHAQGCLLGRQAHD